MSSVVLKNALQSRGHWFKSQCQQDFFKMQLDSSSGRSFRPFARRQCLIFMRQMYLGTSNLYLFFILANLQPWWSWISILRQVLVQKIVFVGRWRDQNFELIRAFNWCDGFCPLYSFHSLVFFLRLLTPWIICTAGNTIYQFDKTTELVLFLQRRSNSN